MIRTQTHPRGNPCEDNREEKTAVYKPKREAPKIHTRQYFDLGLLASGTVRKEKSLLFKSPSLWDFVTAARADSYRHDRGCHSSHPLLSLIPGHLPSLLAKSHKGQWTCPLLLTQPSQPSLGSPSFSRAFPPHDVCCSLHLECCSLQLFRGLLCSSPCKGPSSLSFTSPCFIFFCALHWPFCICLFIVISLH